MDINGFIEQLANGPFLVFAFIVGLIVSIDVSVVEFTREYPEKSKGHIFHRRKLWMAFWHSLFHSLSFLIYMLLIWGFQGLLFWPFDIWDVPDGVGIALLTIVNFFIICFVWWTYRDKVMEDHSEKANDENAVDRSDMQLFVDVVRAIAQKFGISDGARGISIAGAVAVDMLAISALLKTYLIPNDGSPPTSSLTGHLLVDLIIFSAVVFVVVGCVVVSAQTWGDKFRRNLRRFDFIAVLRLIEPFAVFVIVAGTLRHLLEFYSGLPSSITGFWAYGFDLVFSAGIVFSLVKSTGLTWDELNSIYSKANNDEDATNPEITFSDIWYDLKKSAPVFGYLILSFAVVSVVVIFSYSTAQGSHSHNHLVESTGIIAGICLLITLVILYAPSEKLDHYETDQSSVFSELGTESARQIWARFWGILLALTLFNILNFVFAGWQATEVQAIVYWSVYILLTILLFDMRRWRFLRIGGISEGGGRENDSLFAELISAIAMSSSLVALAATLFVTSLKV